MFQASFLSYEGKINMRKMVKFFIAVFIAATCIVPLQRVGAVDGTPIDLVRLISRNDGGGIYGTHKNPSYMEGTTQYYRDGDIIEVDIQFPKNHGAQVFQQVIQFDSSKLELLSSNSDIRASLNANYRSKDWTLTAARFEGDSEKIHIFGSVDDWTNVNTKDLEGGTIAKMYFKVKTGVETEAGTEVKFSFTRFQAAENLNGKMAYTHIGYDANNDAATAYYDAPDQTIVVKKPSVLFHATNGFITQSQAKALATQNDLKAYNGVSASLSDGTILDVNATTGSFALIKAGVLGAYDVTYGYVHSGNSDNKSVKLNVVRDDAIISPEKTFALYAETAFIEQSDAVKLASANDLISLHNATVTLADGTSVAPQVSAPTFASIKAGTLGAYSVTYSYGNGANMASKTVLVHVVKDGSVISPDKEASLYAENGFIKQSEAKALGSKNGLIAYNNAEVTLADGSKVAPTITVGGSEWLAISNGIVGSYSVLYEYGSGVNAVHKQVKVTVIKDEDVISPDKKVSLSAESVEISESEAKALTGEQNLVALNKASVALSDGSITTPNISVANYVSIKAGIVGTYPVTYSYGSGMGYVSKVVNVTVVEDKKHVIATKDAMITVDEAKALSSKEDLRKVNSVVVTAIDGSNPNAVVTTNDWNVMKAGTLGSYVIAYSYGTGDKLVTVNATVKVVENGSIIGDEASLYAKHGFVYQSAAKGFATKNDLIEANSAKVTLLAGGSANPSVAMNTAEWMLLNAGDLGTYNVIYTYGSGVNLLSKSVTATVIKDGSVISEDETASLYAEHAFLSSTNAKALVNKEALRGYNKAQVTLINGTTVNATVSIAANDWLAVKQGIVGSYDVLYTYGSGTSEVSKAVKIVVVADNPVISEDGKIALNATNGEIADDEAKKITSKEDLISYNNAVVTLEDGQLVNPQVAISTSSLNAIKAGTLGTYTVVYYYGVEGTTSYASKSVQIEVVKKTEARILFDYDKNGRIDVLDFAEFKRIMSYPSSQTVVEVMLSDANNDGRVDVLDLAECQYYLSNPTKTPPTVYVPVG